jgi:uncharacterized protein (DUF736 family)
MANPLRFETLDKNLGLEKGTVESWSKQPGFPAAGAGVALQDAVVAWQKSLLAGTNDSVAVVSDGPAPAEVAHVVATEVTEESGVKWLTIRIPVKLNAPAVPGTNPVPTFRLSSSERHIRDAWGAVHHGCRDTHQQMLSGSHVDKVSHTLKYMLELVSVAMKAAR